MKYHFFLPPCIEVLLLGQIIIGNDEQSKNLPKLAHLIKAIKKAVERHSYYSNKEIKYIST